MEKSKLLDRCGAEGEDRLLLAKVLDRAAQAEERNIPACTDFLSPQQQMMAGDLLRLAGIPETAWLRQGGYQGAERNILLFLPDWMEPETAEPPLRCLRAAFRPDDRLNHRDILGSLMGMGIVREKVGDILVCPESADLIVLDTVAELFDLPADLVAGLPHLEMMGSRQLYLEHHTGILAYSDEQIDVNTTGGVLRVRGARLALMAMTAEELRIGGDIAAVEWVR